MVRVVACGVNGVMAWNPKFGGMMTWRGLATQIRDGVKDALRLARLYLMIKCVAFNL